MTSEEKKYATNLHDLVKSPYSPYDSYNQYLGKVRIDRAVAKYAIEKNVTLDQARAVIT